MRKIEKKFNLIKANLLAENRYLENKTNSDDNILSAILSPHDGPVDEFVAISNAIEMASKGGNPEAISNALYQALAHLKKNGNIDSSEPMGY